MTNSSAYAQSGQPFRLRLAGRWGGRLLIGLFLLVIAGLILFPLVVTGFGSLMTNAEITAGGKLIPAKWQFINYKEAWVQANFSRFLWNSLFLSAASTVGTLIVASMAAYVVERMTFPGKALFVGLQASTMFISIGAVVLRPQFQLMVKLHLHTTLWGVVLILISAHAYIFFILLSFLKGLSRELDEAARIDGCSNAGIYWRIILPLLRPALGVGALFTFCGAWNEYLRPLVFTLNNPELQTLTVGLSYLRYGPTAAVQTHYMFAGACLSILPLLLAYAVANRSFMQMTAGSLKG
ncbi:carbohydrate ABC transporter permease [Paenibacillus methanolicus]|uniref:Multiple sugar transport system permease protein n=1 Tax=Paenibacillus methanolicus TaxID=582686 RepID=A0A5S5CH96_9BACL|nr:carbohydrate ABC transporter permease [Paenibacillus methanolicus]TYP79140.1 multiple sugar transport system permease protein [Paenibacillus methanolicus]